mmetsp:Transcript_40226/g.113910  ORF Transcript_40226/g.113910 Transcript_40226/m.113910 type:complete len:337 (-) Transcript_40226:271-1281(-)|eukprot:CAMPEP_0117679684 /NCGR_PEP_ID=MMETSP0804-20121206/17942_1 /TAXON_ID=1074897 /ORGANISM="Tetraselmis astigmatica, Strain CCMP880" /LENGTH=336 /DNA_ID=CAMNT_0005489115 /DNA_START=266 /DNA_END=1276 /DNA_ORIENTATION=+
MAQAGIVGFLRTVAVVCAWYFWSSAVIFTNRHLLTSGLTAPISLTLIHMTGSSIFANGAVSFGGFEKQYLQSRKQTLKVALLSATFGTSVVCGTATLRFIPVSFNELIAATTPLFAAVFTYLTMKESQGYAKSLSLIVIALGCMIASKGEASWNLVGFLLSVTATATRAMRTVLGELLMASETEKLSSMNLLRYMSSMVVLMLIPVVLVVEGHGQLVNVVLGELARGNSSFVFWFFFNIVSAFSVNWCQLLVTKYVGSVAQQVLGIFKGVSSSILSVFIFRNPVTVMAGFGYLTTVAGVAGYTTLRHYENQARGAKKVIDVGEDNQKLLGKSPPPV